MHMTVIAAMRVIRMDRPIEPYGGSSRRGGRTANAPVLKTGVRKNMRVLSAAPSRIPEMSDLGYEDRRTHRFQG